MISTSVCGSFASAFSAFWMNSGSEGNSRSQRSDSTSHFIPDPSTTSLRTGSDSNLSLLILPLSSCNCWTLVRTPFARARKNMFVLDPPTL